MITHYQESYVAGGYFITSPSERPTYIDSHLFPAQLLSATNCMIPLIPYSWTTNWSTYNVVPDRIPDLEQWVTTHFDEQVGFPNVFYTPEVAMDFRNRFLPKDQEAVILGIGLYPDGVTKFLLANQQARERERTDGINTMLNYNNPLAAGGEPLGFEVLWREYHQLHSWLCPQMYRYVFEDGYPVLGIRPNAWGVLSTLAEAQRYAHHANMLETDTVDPWLPWLIVKY